jgi:hypothetical protein
LENRPVIWLAFGLFLAVAAAVTGLGLGRLDRVSIVADELQGKPFVVADALLRAHEHVHNLQTGSMTSSPGPMRPAPVRSRRAAAATTWGWRRH